MGIGKERSIIRFILLALVATPILGACLFTHTGTASAQSVVLTQPAPGPLTSPFGLRFSGSGYHQGNDFGTPAGTPITPRGSVQCTGGPTSTGGIFAVASHACCVVERWLHLSVCALPNIQTGGTGYNPNSSTHTYPVHQHWDIAIMGVKVDPQLAQGQNLCDPAVQQRLIADGQARFPQNGGGGAANSGSGCTAPQPPQQPTNSIVTVPAVPATPTTPGTPAVTIITTPTGQVFTIVNPVPGAPLVSLPPSIDTGFTQNVNTSNPVSGCATDTWEAMVNQAVLQTRREMAVNETLVAKADSTLAYACVQQQITHAAQFVGPIFSETAWWANRQVTLSNLGTTGVQSTTIQRQLGANSLDGALNAAAYLLIEQYLIDAFNHDYLGEIAGPTGLTAGGASGGTTTPPSAADDDIYALQGQAPCGLMGRVWTIAKCLNTNTTLGFPDFTSLINNDPRIYPGNMACADSGITQNMINVAKGQNVRFDPANAYSTYLNPGGNSCVGPVFTGIKVQRRQGPQILSTLLEYDDAVCISPGCSFQGVAGTGTCVP